MSNEQCLKITKMNDKRDMFRIKTKFGTLSFIDDDWHIISDTGNVIKGKITDVMTLTKNVIEPFPFSQPVMNIDIDEFENWLTCVMDDKFSRFITKVITNTTITEIELDLEN